MRGRESIIHIYIAERREALGKSGIIRFFAGMKARVFQHQYLSRRERLDRRFGFRANAIFGKRDWLSAKICQFCRDRAKAVFQIRFAIRPAEMRKDDDFRAGLDEFIQRRQQPFQPRGIGYAAVFHWHVEVRAQKHGFAVQGEIIEGQEIGHGVTWFWFTELGGYET